MKNLIALQFNGPLSSTSAYAKNVTKDNRYLQGVS